VIFVRTISRYRDHAADRGSALTTGAPEQLMSAPTAVAGDARGDLRRGAGSALSASSRRAGGGSSWSPTIRP
jgi:Zn-dependent protease with chaperone function